MGVPSNGWFGRDKHIKMDELGEPPSQETSICVCVYIYIYSYLYIIIYTYIYSLLMDGGRVMMVYFRQNASDHRFMVYFRYAVFAKFSRLLPQLPFFSTRKLITQVDVNFDNDSLCDLNITRQLYRSLCYVVLATDFC